MTKMWRLLHIIAVPLILVLCLLTDYKAAENIPIIGNFYSLFHSKATQWVLVLILCVAFIWLLNLERIASSFWCPGNPDMWLFILCIVGLISFFCRDSTASFSTQALILLGAIAIGKGAKLRTSWKISGYFDRIILSDFVVLIATLLFGIFSNSQGAIYRYHDLLRWTGIWQDPNTFGLLMGTGVVLAVGTLMLNYRNRNDKGEVADQNKKDVFKVGLFLLMISFATAAGCMLMGLFKSYSRGAWLGASLAMVYLLFKAAGYIKDSCISQWIRKNALSLGVALSAGFILIFWHYQYSEHSVVQKVFSATNMNDFSWRNRIAAWEGALQIMAESPWLGLNWSDLKPLYANYYLSPKLNVSEAIQINDYLMLGATLGIPVLLCFGIYLWLLLAGEPDIGNQELKISRLDWLITVCRAAAIVLLVGFWFDGGLFKVSTAVTFWILLEMGASNHQSLSAAEKPVK